MLSSNVLFNLLVNALYRKMAASCTKVFFFILFFVPIIVVGNSYLISRSKVYLGFNYMLLYSKWAIWQQVLLKLEYLENYNQRSFRYVSVIFVGTKIQSPYT